MRICAKIVCLGALTALAISAVWAQGSDEGASRSKILALEHAWNQAEAFQDVQALDALFDNGLIYIDSDGTMWTKAEFLAHVKEEHMQQVITQSMVVQIFGDTAVVTGTYQASEFKNGRPLVHRGRFVDTWVFRGSVWVCIAAAATPFR
jgi:Domain of unknown function (DUF4440)